MSSLYVILLYNLFVTIWCKDNKQIFYFILWCKDNKLIIYLSDVRLILTKNMFGNLGEGSELK